MMTTTSKSIGVRAGESSSGKSFRTEQAEITVLENQKSILKDGVHAFVQSITT